jgi:hypothetical protein
MTALAMNAASFAPLAVLAANSNRIDRLGRCDRKSDTPVMDFFLTTVKLWDDAALRDSVLELLRAGHAVHVREGRTSATPTLHTDGSVTWKTRRTKLEWTQTCVKVAL